ncbi:hypothetical protein V7S57_23440 [Caulobacter sp. CCNWLY153]|uniref:hypothetical protein n=1 Tax=unclassified Caulobacter TaxID=2648921 RepID=UPI002FF0C09F
MLRDRAEELDNRLIGIWPKTKFERQGFDLIRRTYVEARYSDHYRISDEHLIGWSNGWLRYKASLLKSARSGLRRFAALCHSSCIWEAGGRGITLPRGSVENFGR